MTMNKGNSYNAYQLSPYTMLDAEKTAIIKTNSILMQLIFQWRKEIQ